MDLRSFLLGLEGNFFNLCPLLSFLHVCEYRASVTVNERGLPAALHLRNEGDIELELCHDVSLNAVMEFGPE